MLKRLLQLFVVLALLVGAYLALDRLAPEPMAAGTLKLQRGLAGMEQKQVSIPGFDIAYIESGEGEPLVLVHGIGADKDNFTPVAGLIKGLGRTIALDLPGFGESSKPADGDYDIPAQVEYLRAFLDALDLPAVHLGGSSMGGMIVASFAAKYPERTKSLWLLAPAGVLSAPDARVRTAFKESGELLLFAEKPEDFDRILATVFVQRPPLPWSVRHKLAQRAVENYPLHKRIFERITDNYEAWALEPQVQGLSTPTLIVWGDQDLALHVGGGTILKELMPNSELVVLPGVGHLPMLEKPFRAARDYKAFRQKLAAATP